MHVKTTGEGGKTCFCKAAKKPHQYLFLLFAVFVCLPAKAVSLFTDYFLCTEGNNLKCYNHFYELMSFRCSSEELLLVINILHEAIGLRELPVSNLRQRLSQVSCALAFLPLKKTLKKLQFLH